MKRYELRKIRATNSTNSSSTQSLIFAHEFDDYIEKVYINFPFLKKIETKNINGLLDTFLSSGLNSYDLLQVPKNDLKKIIRNPFFFSIFWSLDFLLITRENKLLRTIFVLALVEKFKKNKIQGFNDHLYQTTNEIIKRHLDFSISKNTFEMLYTQINALLLSAVVYASKPLFSIFPPFDRNGKYNKDLHLDLLEDFIVNNKNLLILFNGDTDTDDLFWLKVKNTDTKINDKNNVKNSLITEQNLGFRKDFGTKFDHLINGNHDPFIQPLILDLSVEDFKNFANYYKLVNSDGKKFLQIYNLYRGYFAEFSIED